LELIGKVEEIVKDEGEKEIRDKEIEKKERGFVEEGRV
jgi:hypothetical protein